MSAAPAPARKTPASEGAPDAGTRKLSTLMREMGSLTGEYTGTPPDQLNYFLGKAESPLQRLLAIVRAKTLGRGHRSPYCVDDAGKELRQADLRRELGMEWGNFRRAMTEAVARGLIRVGGAEPGNNRSTHNSRHLHRVFLCATVPESVGYRENTDFSTSLYRLVTLTPAVRKIVGGWSAEAQQRFYASLEVAVKYKRQVEAEALAAARAEGDRAVGNVMAEFRLPVKKLPKRAAEPKLVRIQLVSASGNESVQTQSEQTSASESVRTDERESVRTAPSLLCSEKTEKRDSSSSSELSLPVQRDDDDDLHREVAEWMRSYSTEHGRDLGEPDPAIVRRVVRAMHGASLAELDEFSTRLLARRVGPSQTYGWFVAVVEEEFHESKTKKRSRTATAP